MENNEVMVQEQAPNMPNMNGGIMPQFNDINQGTVLIEQSRAIAEAQGKLVIAKRFPRDEVSAYAKAMEACQRPTMAEKAFYSFPRGSQTVEGLPAWKSNGRRTDNPFCRRISTLLGQHRLWN